ncbi:MAG: aldehyde dehydrogenase family protein [Thermoleophilia bacterium]|nr:aldehyde dehydrogenase family protein [Thermoleophilia bacterium]
MLPVTGESVVRSPFDGAEIARVGVGGEAAVLRAVAVARSALGHAPIAAERARILDRASAMVRDRAEELAWVIAGEAGKPIRQARVEVARCMDTLAFSAAVARTLSGEVIPMDAADSGAGLLGYTVREPVGVIAAITPFNFPLNLVAHKVGPAVAVGAPMVLKPAGRAPLAGLALAAILVECGLPGALLTTVVGDREAGEPLVAHPDIAMISFTGSSAVGFDIRRARPDIRVALELGNATPVIVHADADIPRAARAIAESAFTHAGQSCISAQRILVHREVHDSLVAALLPLVDALVVGDPLDEATDVGPVIDEASADRIRAWVGDAVAAGARLLRGGWHAGGATMVPPTVLDGVAPSTRVMRDEIFGPVIAIAVYDHIPDAIAMANASPLGLQAGIFTAQVDRALGWARHLDYGAVVINETPAFRADHMPYGGVRGSGDAREGPASAAMEMTRPKLVIVRIGDQ